LRKDKYFEQIERRARRQTSPDRCTAGQKREVKLGGSDQRVEQSPARDEGTSNTELWSRIWECQNMRTALERVERNGGAPGIEGVSRILGKWNFTRATDPQTEWLIG